MVARDPEVDKRDTYDRGAYNSHVTGYGVSIRPKYKFMCP
jgi:hypothetical protein